MSMVLKCEEVRDRFSALWENELTPSERTEVKGHLDRCAECREEFARFEKTLRLLHSVEEKEVPESFLVGIYEKLEERKRKDLPAERTFWRWPNLPLRLKLPMQALAMVAIVFMALYLTKMTPGDLTRMKEVTESKPSLQEEKKAYGEIRTPASEKKSSDQLSLQRRADKIEKGEFPGRLKEKAKPGMREREPTSVANEPAAGASGITSQAPSNMAAAPATPKTEAERSSQSLAGKPEKTAETREALKQPEEKVSGDKPDLRSKFMTPSPARRSREAEAPLSLSAKTNKAEGASIVHETTGPGPKSSPELVLKISDRKEVLSRLQELMKEWGGEIRSVRGNRLLISFPGFHLSEFQKELGKMGSIAKAQERVDTTETPEKAVGGLGKKGKDSEEKDKESSWLEDSREGRILIRLVLEEE
jgi:hypothetical protein